jgi:hypothetical protein
MLGDQQPDTGQVSTRFVSQQLSHTAFNARRITILRLAAFSANAGIDGGLRLITRTTLIEFFFEARNPQ